MEKRVKAVNDIDALAASSCASGKRGMILYGGKKLLLF
jgi:hypothetical protein